MRIAIIIILVAFILSGCITTNYYTARTLDKGTVVLTPGVDNLVWIENDGDVVDKDLSFTVSFGIAVGLPWRFETGIRGYYPYIYEANIRHQLNPKSFKLFDISANFHMGYIFSDGFEDVSPPYYKYGITVSKEIKRFQPYFSYYLNNSYFINGESDNGYDYTIFCFGLAIPNHDDLIFPEINYYKNEVSGVSYYSIGIGLRTAINKIRSPGKKAK